MLKIYFFFLIIKTFLCNKFLKHIKVCVITEISNVLNQRDVLMK